MNETTQLEIARQCKAHRKNGTQCKKSAIRGSVVCQKHGGGAPQVKRRAQERLLELVEPAIAGLLRVLSSAKGLCTHCGRSDDLTAITRAAQIVLDRTGFTPGRTITLEHAEPTANYLQWIPTHRLNQINAWIAEAKAEMVAASQRPALPAPEPLAVRVEAEVVDEEPV